MSDWGAPQYDSYSSGRKRGREEEEDYHGDSYRGQQPGYQRRRYNNPYHNDPRGGHWGRDARYSEDSPYYGSRYDNVMRIKQDLWKMLEPEGSRFKSHENTSKRHGLSTEQYESIRKALEENWLKHEQSKLDVLTVFAVACVSFPQDHRIAS